jgi:hypothetical protein
MVQANDEGMREAGRNLLVMDDGPRLAPATGKDALVAMRHWPKLADIAYEQVFMLSGGLDIEKPWEAETLAKIAVAVGAAEAEKKRKQLAERHNAWRMDLVAVSAAKRLAEDSDEANAFRASHADDISAIDAAGLSARLDALAAAQEDGKLIAIRTRDYGVFILWRPDWTAMLEWMHRDQTAPLDALDRLTVAAVRGPGVGPGAAPAPDMVTLSRLLEAHPALSSALATLAQELWGEDIEAEVKKE